MQTSDRRGRPAFLRRVWRADAVDCDPRAFPGNLPILAELDLQFDHAVTFFVGENGSGKSTLLEAIADLCGLPTGGGGRNDISGQSARHEASELAPLLLASFTRRPRNGYFFRAELQERFAALLERRDKDPHFLLPGGVKADPFEQYGGRSLNARSHGEAFLEMFHAWMRPGMILMDEPEAALSPQRQLALLVKMHQLCERGGAQFVIATHSPILMTLPGAALLSFDDGTIRPTTLEETPHYQVTRGILDDPDRWWRELSVDGD